MTLADLNRRHLGLVSSYATRHALRGGTGLVFLLITVMFGLMTAHMIITPIEQLRAQQERQGREVDGQELVDQLLGMARPVVTWAITAKGAGEDEKGASAAVEQADAWTDFLLHEHPALLSAVLLIMLFAMPFLAATGAFNQLSGDIQTRGLRYQLLRTERANIFFGRFLGTAAFAALVTAFVITVIVVYLGTKMDLYAWGPLVAWGLRGWLALAVVSLPYVALCSWLSGAIDSPFASLVIAKIVIGIVPLFGLIGRNSWEPLVHARFALPWGVQNHLLHPEASHALGAAAACLGYTVLFLLLGYRHFARRDL